jgi:hypothetical protein
MISSDILTLRQAVSYACHNRIRGCKSLSVICLSSLRLHPSGVRWSGGERSEPSAAEPRGVEARRARGKLVEGGSTWFPVEVSTKHCNRKFT